MLPGFIVGYTTHIGLEEFTREGVVRIKTKSDEQWCNAIVVPREALFDYEHYDEETPSPTIGVNLNQKNIMTKQ